MLGNLIDYMMLERPRASWGSEAGRLMLAHAESHLCSAMRAAMGVFVLRAHAMENYLAVLQLVGAVPCGR